MFLHKLRIRGKLGALVLIPLVVIAALAITVLVGQIRSASAASRTLDSISVASQVGVVVADLQAERLDSIGYLVGTAEPADVETARATLDQQIADLRAQFGGSLSPDVNKALSNVSSLAKLRTDIDAQSASTADVISGFSPVINGLLDATHLVNGVDTSTEAGREIIALDSLDHIDELTNESAALLLQISGLNHNASAQAVEQHALLQYNADQIATDTLLPRFTSDATAADVSLHDLASQAYVDRVGPGFAASFAQDPAGTALALSAPIVYPQMQSFITLGRFAEQKIAADVVSAVDSQRIDTLIEAYVTGGIVLIVVLGVALLGGVIARSVAVPLSDLTASTHRVALLAEAELQRVADDEAESEAPIHFEPVQVATEDEIGELAQAFERISSTSVQLVARQVTSRRNVAQMFGHVGRRTQNLVGRQIALIDALEAQETDTRRLEDLYRLDHLTSRLRRNASSLVALSGTSDSGGHFAPLPIVDVVRLALGEIEEYTRVDLEVMPDLQITPGAINDLVLLLAELLENATTFSPPHTRVSVAATDMPPRLSITDHGIGLTPNRLAAENARLASRERLDLAPTEVLGLFVVGRLARRHGLGVVMMETPGGGVTVTVDLRGALISAGPSAAALRADPVASRPFGPGSFIGEPRSKAPQSPSAPQNSSWPPQPGAVPPYQAVPHIPEQRPAQPPEAWPAATSPAPLWEVQTDPRQADPRSQPPDPWQRDPRDVPPSYDPALGGWAPAGPASGSATYAGTSYSGTVYGTSPLDAARPELPEPNRPSLPVPVDAAKLDRANRAIEASGTWRAFEVPIPALAATPYEPPPEDMTDAPASSFELPAQPFAGPEWTPAAHPGESSPLPRRSATAEPPEQPTPDHPENGHTVDPEFQTMVLPAVSAGGPLTRRVPGATLGTDPVTPTRQTVAPQDPDDVWNLVNQFEAGVTRALHEVRSDATEEEPQT